MARQKYNNRRKTDEMAISDLISTKSTFQFANTELFFLRLIV